MKEIKIKLVHYKNPELGEEWKKLFEFESDVEIVEGDIFELEWDAIVSPGNSFGFMDGGLDLLISKKFGWGIQKELKERIEKSELKELLVGQAEVIKIEGLDKYVICAPTMRVPTSLLIANSVNSYLAMKGILLASLKEKNIETVAISGLCTGTGGMNAKTSARQMYMAFQEVVLDVKPEFPTFMDAQKYHFKLNSKKTI